VKKKIPFISLLEYFILTSTLSDVASFIPDLHFAS